MGTLKAWKFLASMVLLDHPRIKVVEDTVQLPSGQLVPYVRFDGASHAVTVICIREGQILLQREYSYPMGEFLLNFEAERSTGTKHPNRPPHASCERDRDLCFPSVKTWAGICQQSPVGC